jgi:hypothetical protein
MSESKMTDEHLRRQFQDNLPNVDADHGWARLQVRLADELPSGSARPLRRRRRAMITAVAVGASVIVVALFAAAALGLFGGGTQMASVEVTAGPTGVGPGTATTTRGSHTGTTTSSSPGTTEVSENVPETTTSSTLLFPSQLSFMEELSGDGYQTAIVFTDQEGGTLITKVWIMVDSDHAARATNDVIFEHALDLAEKYGAADYTEGRLRVELSDAPPGELIKDHIIESRDFDLTETTTSMTPDTTADTVPTKQ